MRYAAFLRAINVGGRVVRMDRLRGLFEDLGFSNVRTVIASGNVVFDAAPHSPRALEARIQRRLHEELGYDVVTFLRSIPELHGVLASSPLLPAGTGETLYIGFLAAAPRETVTRSIEAAQTPTDRLALRGRELYWLISGRYSASSLAGPRLEKLLGAPTTLRKVETIRRMVEGER